MSLNHERITIEAADWNCSPSDVRSVAQSVLETFREASGYEAEPGFHLLLRRNENPRAHYNRGPDGRFVIQISIGDRLWANVAYQFAHETCHFMTRFYLQPLDRPMRWFDESLCELASLFVLRRMAATWATAPPYPHWASYSAALDSYDKERLQHLRTFVSPNDFRSWLSEELPALNRDAVIRDLNAIVAWWLLPVFLDDPMIWKATEFINDAPDISGDPQCYFESWLASTDLEAQPFVRKICARMGFDLVA